MAGKWCCGVCVIRGGVGVHGGGSVRAVSLWCVLSDVLVNAFDDWKMLLH